MKGGQNAKKQREVAGSRKDGGGAANATVEMARQLAAIVEAHALSELVVDTPELTLTLRRGVAHAAHSHSIVMAPAATSAALPAHAPAPSRTDAEPKAASGAAAALPMEPDYHLVTSPFVGTFYRSPTPDADPYVVEGTRVEKGQVLCIVEAMKLMNEIEADKAGVISAVLVQNAQPVEYGQPLFKIAPP